MSNRTAAEIRSILAQLEAAAADGDRDAIAFLPSFRDFAQRELGCEVVSAKAG